MATGYKIVDGVRMPLSPAEQADFDARQQAWSDAAPARAARQQRNDDIANDPDRKDLMDKLANATNAQVDNWVDNNINATDLQTLRAQTRRMFKIILRMMASTAPPM
jgi:hypothetical protein